jgi:heat shock protein HtpX
MRKEIDSNKKKTWLILILMPMLIIGLAYVFSYEYPVILPIAIVIAGLQAWAGYFYSDKIALAVSGAREIDKQSNPEIYRMVENLAITAGLPMPRVYLINDEAPNAFATGRDPKHSAIALTTGLIQKLEKSEIEGVIAHELAHIQNYDIRLMTVMVVMVGIVALMADFFLRMSFWGRGRKRDSNSGIDSFLAILGIVLAILAPLFASIINLAMSRRREYLADASGALLTRYPEGLASALEKISADRTTLASANRATAHLFISNPLKNKKDGGNFFADLFSTHPPSVDRVKKLRGMIRS